jgi:Uncharacterised methyltransferase family (DUF6094)
MGLLHPRLAHNLAKNGYYPTDDETVLRILNALDVPESAEAKSLYLLDPCCGEGLALNEIKHHLSSLGSESGVDVKSYGIEYDHERAHAARSILDVAAHCDVNDMSIKAKSFGLLFLNPPYGDMVKDKAGLSELHDAGGRERLEKMFYQKTVPWLMPDGVLILIVPSYSLDTELSELIAKQFTRVRVFMAAVDQFKQCVIFGVRRKTDYIDPKLAERLVAIGKAVKASQDEPQGLPEMLPEMWKDAPYVIPAYQAGKASVAKGAASAAPHFKTVRITWDGIEWEAQRLRKSTLWPQFELRFAQSKSAHRRPLTELRPWHLALALAAGQIQGVVTSKSGRQLLVKGDTFKARSEKVLHEASGSKDGDVVQKRIYTDKFVPSIRAIEFTPGEQYGNLVTIQ